VCSPSSHADSKSITSARKPLSMFQNVFDHIDKAARDDNFPKLDTTEFSKFLGFNVKFQHDIGDYIDAFGSKLSDALRACEQGKYLSWGALINAVSAALKKQMSEVVCRRNLLDDSFRTPSSMQWPKPISTAACDLNFAR
jgi:hypothetical protein